MHGTGAMTYCTVLLFPHGTEGYSERIARANACDYVSPAEYCRHHRQIHTTKSNVLLKSRRLTQQYATDAFAKVEA